MDHILSALNALNCSELNYTEWIEVGMALKTEGYDVRVWDEWSSRDPARYHPGECEDRWRSFHGSENPVTGGTIVKMAQDRGWQPFTGPEAIMDWGDVLEYDGDEPGPQETARSGTGELILYLETLFLPWEHVGYVTNHAWQDKDGKWKPGQAVFHQTAGELIASLRSCPEDPGATIGDWKPQAGAWICPNALDGKGTEGKNVTGFRYALVESDETPPKEQIALYRKLQLPIAALVSSGKRSVHAIVRVDAQNAAEHRKRVNFLYDFLAARGLKVDPQNKNPNRLSRMPGIPRDGQPQKLLGVNIGRKSWVDWIDFVEGLTDQLPGMHPLSDFTEHPPALPEEMIFGVLRRGHKMLISGSSKAGKSFLLMELCIAFAEGGEWLGFRCRQGKALYVNLEIDPASCIHRFLKIYEALGMPPEHPENIVIWNLRGHAIPLDQLVPKLVRRVQDLHPDVIILDPIYKVITGDENSASDMAVFCNQFDRICRETGCSVIYCHHHSKGVQGAKRAMDRASGSGVFARDPDAQLDMIELELSEEVRNWEAPQGATAWRLESSLREFENFRPVDFWFSYPIHRVDQAEALQAMPTQGSPDAGRMKNKRRKSTEEANEEFQRAYQALNMKGNGVTVKDMAAYLEIAERTVRDRIRILGDSFELVKGEGIIRSRASVCGQND